MKAIGKSRGRLAAHFMQLMPDHCSHTPPHSAQPCALQKIMTGTPKLCDLEANTLNRQCQSDYDSSSHRITTTAFTTNAK
jgi:hypothetical protein